MKEPTFLNCLLLLLVTMGKLTYLQAQNYVDIFKIDYSISPNNQFDNSSETTDIYELNADLNVPIELSEKNVFITGFQYDTYSASLYEGFRTERLHGITLKVGLNHTYSSDWSSTTVLLFRYASDAGKWGWDQFQIGGIALFKKTIREELNYKFGIYTNTEFFGQFLVPIFGMYTIKGPWEVNLTLPISVDINYSFTESWRLGLKYEGLIKSYNLNSPGYDPDQYLAKANNELGLYLQAAKGPLHFRLFTGYSLGRSYRTYTDAEKNDFTVVIFKFGDNRTQLNTDFANGLVLKAGFTYRFDLSKKSSKK